MSFMRTWLIRAAVGYTNEHLLRSGEELLRAKPRQLFHHRQHGIAPLFMIESAMLAVPICRQRLEISVSFNLSDVLKRERIGQR